MIIWSILISFFLCCSFVKEEARSLTGDGRREQELTSVPDTDAGAPGGGGGGVKKIKAPYVQSTRAALTPAFPVPPVKGRCLNDA